MFECIVEENEIHTGVLFVVFLEDLRTFEWPTHGCSKTVLSYLLKEIFGCRIILNVFVDASFAHVQSRAVVTKEGWLPKDDFTLPFQGWLIVD